MQRFWIAIFALLLSSAAQAQSPSLTARINGVEGEETKALKIASLDIDVQVRGSLATTTLTIAFLNPTNDTLEGDFTLTMPEGSVVTGYALDVEGVMIDGVLQARDRARAAYEARVAQGVDPGLVEVDYSNRFSTRVFPILPKQGRTIRVSFVTPLDADGRYFLPLETEAVRAYSIAVSGSTPRGDDWIQEDQSWRLSGEGKLDRTVTIDVPFRPSFTVSEHPGKGQFFEYRGLMSSGGPRTVAGPLTIFWDRSLSRRDDALKREIALAESIAERLGVETLQLHTFDSSAVLSSTVRATELASLLAATDYGGGTSYTGISEPLRAATGTCVLFTDGQATLGDRKNVAPGCQLLAVSSGEQQDDLWLAVQANSSGGVAVNLATMDNREALHRLFAPRGAPKLTDGAGNVIATRALTAPDAGFRLIGKVPDDGQVVSSGGSMPAREFGAPFFAGPGALWGEQELTLARDSLSPDAFAALAREWSVAVPGVSFVVLESPEDYVEAGFEPPASYPEERLAKFYRLREEQDNWDKERAEDYLDTLEALWAQRKAWWERTDFSDEARGEPGGEAAEAAADSAMADAEAVAEEAPPPAPPPPPPPQDSVPPAEALQERIVVTANRRSDSPYSGEEESDELAMAGDSEADEGAEAVEARIEVAPWSAKRAYVEVWSAAEDQWQAAVTQTEAEHGGIPLFYFDLAEWHFQAGRSEEAKRAIASALELPSRNNQTLEIVAQRMLRYGAFDEAIWLLELVAEREAERPQPILALALAHAKRGRASGQTGGLAIAEQMLTAAALKPWPDIFDNVGEILLAEANALVVEMDAATAAKADLPEQFRDPMPVGLRVLAFWNTPRVDLDLWVVEPSEEEVGYSNRLSASGGRYTHDLTNGFGPEEYMIRRASDGTYLVEVNTFSSDAINPNGPSTVTVRLIRNFGTPEQSEQMIDVEMVPDAASEGRGNGRVLIGRFTLGEGE